MTAAVSDHMARSTDFLNSIGIAVALEPGGIKVDPACPPRRPAARSRAPGYLPEDLEEVYKLPAYPRLARWTQL